MTFTLPPLPYDEDALAPYISQETLSFHYGKHHQGYVNALNKLIAGKPQEDMDLEEIIMEAAKEIGEKPAGGVFEKIKETAKELTGKSPIAMLEKVPLGPDEKMTKVKENMLIFNNAAQVWNHTFFWHCMIPNGGGQPHGEVLDRISDTFGGFEKFKEEFKNAAISQFGSGWAWLVMEDDDELQIVKTKDAMTPIVHGFKPLLTCDVWEHAYYLDYQNRRPDFVQAFLDHLVNWRFVEQNMMADSYAEDMV